MVLHNYAARFEFFTFGRELEKNFLRDQRGRKMRNKRSGCNNHTS
jgi:hypothetical protein